jgi:hypothetical protein
LPGDVGPSTGIFLGLRQISRFTVRFKNIHFFFTGAFPMGIPMGSPVAAFSAFLVALAFNPFNG